LIIARIVLRATRSLQHVYNRT